MPYNLRPRTLNPSRLQPRSRYNGKSETAKHDLKPQSRDISQPMSASPHTSNSVAAEGKEPEHLFETLTSTTEVAHAGCLSPVLVAASPSNPLTQLPDEVCEFLDPIEVGRGRSGVVYRVQIRSNDYTQFIAVKMFEDIDDFEQEIKTYSHLISRGIQDMIPDVYGYRRWRRSQWEKEFPTLHSWDMPNAGGIFMEYLGPDLKPVYDDSLEIDPTYIADYLDIMWMLRKTHVYHKDIDLNLFLAGPERRLVVLDFAYSTLSLTSNALETDWKNSTEGIMKECVCFQANFVDV